MIVISAKKEIKQTAQNNRFKGTCCIWFIHTDVKMAEQDTVPSLGEIVGGGGGGGGGGGEGVEKKVRLVIKKINDWTN